MRTNLREPKNVIKFISPVHMLSVNLIHWTMRKKRNNSDIDNNSVMLETESNKDCSELTVSQETSLAVQKRWQIQQNSYTYFF